jgi:hypothetical protein
VIFYLFSYGSASCFDVNVNNPVPFYKLIERGDFCDDSFLESTNSDDCVNYSEYSDSCYYALAIHSDSSLLCSDIENLAIQKDCFDKLSLVDDSKNDVVAGYDGIVAD